MSTSYTISGLDPGTYNVKLKARYAGSAGPWKAASSVVVTGDAPPVVVVVPDPTAEPTAEPEPPTSEQQQDDPPTPHGAASQVAHDRSHRLPGALRLQIGPGDTSRGIDPRQATPILAEVRRTDIWPRPGPYNVKLRARYRLPWKAASSVVVTGDAPPVVSWCLSRLRSLSRPHQSAGRPAGGAHRFPASRVAHDSVTLTWTAPTGGPSPVTGCCGELTPTPCPPSSRTRTARARSTRTPPWPRRRPIFYAALALSRNGDGAQSAAVSATTPAAPRSKKGEDKPPPNRVTRAAPGTPLNLTAVAGAFN